VVELPKKLPLNDPEYIPRPVVDPPLNTSIAYVESALLALIAREADNA
jgi:hypothetical protein